VDLVGVEGPERVAKTLGAAAMRSELAGALIRAVWH
jgi:hypothetical protein